METTTATQSTIVLCSGDLTHSVRLTWNAEGADVKSRVPANGVRGQGHVPAHEVFGAGSVEDGVVFWDCPVCDHADSLDPH